MIKIANDIETQVLAFCTRIGADRLLVQGAGGNISWKDGEVLWVKASGTWLADAESKEIFVPVDLASLQNAISKQDFSIKPIVISDSVCRPSIETLLHALMPQKIVLHLHAIEILAHLVRANSIDKISKVIDMSVKWAYVDYCKPGPELAKEVLKKSTGISDAFVVFLGSHGIIIGGNSVGEIELILKTLTLQLKNKIEIIPILSYQFKSEEDFYSRGYVPCWDKELCALAINEQLICRLRNNWALYPDHIVFLGSEPSILEIGFNPVELDLLVTQSPPFIFVIGEGVYEKIGLTLAEKCQLRCYFDIVSRQQKDEQLVVLNKSQILELNGWEAEIYRVGLPH